MSMPILQLHWLPIEWRIRFKLKLATLTYKALHTGRPPHLADLLQLHTTPKSTRSSSSQLLFVPCHNLLVPGTVSEGLNGWLSGLDC